MVMSVLPRLLDAAVSVDLHSSHGATLATGQIVLALAPEETQGAGEGKQISAFEVLTKADLFTRVEELVDRLVAGIKEFENSLGCKKIDWSKTHFVRSFCKF
jgi:hypothetical protein